MFGNKFLLVFGEPDLKRLVTFETFEKNDEATKGDLPTKYLVPIYLLSDAADTYR